MPVIGSFAAGSARGYGQFLRMSAGAAAAGPSDSAFGYVSLLLPGDGTNNSNNNVFLDSSTNNFSITRSGNVTQGTFTPFSQTGWSMYAGSSGATLQGIFLNGESGFAFGTGDFTIELFINLSPSGASQVIYDSRPSSTNGLYPTIYLDNSVTKLKYYTNSADRITQTSIFTYNVWHHVVVTRTGTSTKMFIDGVQEGSTYTDSNNYINGASRPYTSNGFAADSGVLGYISNLRVVKGSGPYQNADSSITVPTSSLTAVTNTVLLTLQSNRFVDTNTQTTAKVININSLPSVQAFSPFAPTVEYTSATVGGSAYFDGASDYLRAGGTVGIASNQFTICFWFYPLSSSVIGLFDSGSGQTNVFRNYSTNVIEDQDTGPSVSFANAYQVNAWNWMCITKSGTSFTVYINGTTVGTGGCSATMTESSFDIGTINSGGAGSYNGYISDFQVLNTATIVAVPTAPRTAVSGTTYLLNFTNPGIRDVTSKNVLETVGDARLSTSQSKFGNSSIFFDGTGDYLVSNSATIDLYAFGTGDFTIEMWIYFNVVNTIQCVYDSRPASTQGNYPLIYLNSDGTLRLFVNSADRITSSALSASTWYHVAVSRSGTSTRLFINGTQSGSTYTDSTSYLNASGRPWIGINAFNTTQGLNGYIDDLRITKGIGRYTANFTAPTAAFPKSASTSGPPTSVEYLVVAGGGGGGGGSITGGYTGGGGGGAGGLQRGIIVPVNDVPITVTIGGGGSAGGTNGFGSNGTNSVFGTITSVGGGGGGHGGGAWIGGTGAYGFSGGSGGGSGYRATFAGLGTSGQGRNGGSAGTGEEGSGGGGGAGAVGVNGSTSPAQYTGGNGGIGIFSSISGSNTAYAGGGGAGGLGTSGYDGRGGFGGQGGGGNGSGVLGDYTTSANNANTNSGAGGGGGSRRVDGGTPGSGGSGGSGIVIIRYASNFADANSTTGTPTYTNSGGFKTYTWTGSGTITF